MKVSEKPMASPFCQGRSDRRYSNSQNYQGKKNYGYGRLMEVLKPSPYRVEPKCEFARQCGGCQLQALSYDQQLDLRQIR